MMPSIRKRISEMAGKGDSWFTRKIFGIFKETGSVDYTRNDYDLFQSLYWASEVASADSKRKVGKQYRLAAALAKPIINSASAFIISSGVTVELDSEFATTEQLEAAEKVINEWLNDNKHNQLDLTKFGLRDGDSYLYVNDKLEADMLDPRTVEVILDAMTSERVGYDVTEQVDEITENGQTKSVTYVKKYRKSRLEIYRMEENEDIGPDKIYYVEVYTDSGKVVLVNQGGVPEEAEMDEDGNVVIYGEVVERPLPIIPIHNEAEPRAVYGNSELQNVLIQFENYTGIMDEATKNVMYNGSPILAMKGAKKKDNMDDKDDDGNERMNWSADSVLFLEGENADAKFLSTGKVMDDAGQLMEYYFYLILQGSETPEFVFGAAVQSSKASVSEQMPIVVLKADRKRTAFTSSFKQLVEVIIDRKIALSDPDMLPLEGIAPKIRIEYPDILDEDRNLTKDTVQMLLEQGIISNRTALRLTVGDKISDLDSELADAKKDQEDALKANAITPDLTGQGDDNADDPNQPTEDGVIDDGNTE